MNKKDTSILEYRKYVLVRDSIADIFRTYVTGYKLDNKLTTQDIERLTDTFEKEYKQYVMDIFVALDIQTKEKDGVNVVVVEEFMAKVAGMASAKLAAELLMIELVKQFVHTKK